MTHWSEIQLGWSCILQIADKYCGLLSEHIPANYLLGKMSPRDSECSRYYLSMCFRSDARVPLYLLMRHKWWVVSEVCKEKSERNQTWLSSFFGQHCIAGKTRLKGWRASLCRSCRRLLYWEISTKKRSIIQPILKLNIGLEKSKTGLK